MFAELEICLRRAEDFSRGMGLLRDDDAYMQSAALLAIHASIAYSDALRVAFGEHSLASEDHQTAVKALRGHLQQEDTMGLTKLQKLLASKNDVAYGNRRMDTQRLRLICIEAERFAVWANRIGTKTQSDGWRPQS